MHLTPKKKIEVYPDTKVVVLRDAISNRSGNSGNSFEVAKEDIAYGASSTKLNTLIYALYGVVELQSQTYLLAVTKAEFAANIAGRNVYLATEFKFIGLGFKDSIEDGYAIDMFNKFFATKSFYFSSEYDLTQPFSKNASRAFRIKKEEHDERFYYNSAFTNKLRELGYQNWIQPFICGLVEQRLLNINRKSICFIIISRRDKSRAGMRFISRGADDSGNVSNFAETEQILTFLNDDNYEIFTYLQTRGSIPLLWKQSPNLKWTPSVVINNNLIKSKSAFENHMFKLKKAYKENFLINLIDKKGSQKRIGEALSDMIRSFNDPSVKYTWFDFHDECKKMQYHNLSRLVNEVATSIKDYKYGHYKTEDNGEVKVEELQKQEGVFRTNCMDCLDRTNVVQSVLARNVLLSQLFSAGIIEKPHGNAFEKLPDTLEETFREFWTDNGNRLSLLYSGTGALKVDFTRTGTRTSQGALEDGQKAITRYFINNFYDTYNQNSLDLLLGKIKFHELNSISRQNPTMTLGVGFAMLVGPYYLAAMMLSLFGKTFNWSFFLILIVLSAFMSYTYVKESSKKLWEERILSE